MPDPGSSDANADSATQPWGPPWAAAATCEKGVPDATCAAAAAAACWLVYDAAVKHTVSKVERWRWK